MIHDKVMSMLRSGDSESSFFPPTVLYNEGWLLRVLLDWFSSQKVENHPLSFSEGAKWFSEALLPSAFLPRSRKDPLGESWTHADGIIGHFAIGNAGRADLSLTHDTSQFVVIEAKMFNKLSPGVTHARYYDQAARSVACMAEVLKKAHLPPAKLSSLGFYVLAPEIQIRKGTFETNTLASSIRNKVSRRVKAYEGEKDLWFQKWFVPTLDRIEIGCLCWEDLIVYIQIKDTDFAEELQSFYDRCRKYNRPSNQGTQT